MIRKAQIAKTCHQFRVAVEKGQHLLPPQWSQQKKSAHLTRRRRSCAGHLYQKAAVQPQRYVVIKHMALVGKVHLSWNEVEVKGR